MGLSWTLGGLLELLGTSSLILHRGRAPARLITLLAPTRWFYLFESTNSTLEAPFPVTVTDFSHVLGGLKTGRCTLCSVSTS